MACGDPVAPGTYLGEPLLRLEGRTLGNPGKGEYHRPYLGILWVNFEEESDTPRVVQVITPIHANRLSRFSVDIWDAPPASAFDSECGLRLVFGSVVAFDDVNGDGVIRIDPFEGVVEAPDKIIGFAPTQFLVYREESGGKEEPGCMEPFGFWGRPGFNVAKLNEDCELSVRPPTEVLELQLLPPSSRFPEVDFSCEDVASEDPDFHG